MANLTIRIDVDNAEANRKLAETDKNVAAIDASADKASKSTGTFETSLSKLGAVTAGVAALKVGFDGLTRFVGASVESFSAQENAVKALTTALEKQGQATPQVIGQYAAMAAQFQNTTVFADELVGEMQGLLVQVGNVMPKDMDRALKASTDLAAGLNIDLRTATMLVGKAFAGETGSLSRYGIVLGDVEEGVDKTALALDLINQKFGGQAQAQLDTYSGKSAALGNKMDDLREQVGGLVVRALMPMLDLFNALPGPVQTIILGAGAMAVTLGPIAIGFGAIASAVGPLLPMLASALPAALSALGFLLGPAGLVIAGIVAVVAAWRNWDAIVGFAKGVYEGVKTWMVDKFNAIVDSIRAKVDAVTGFFKGMYDKVVGHSYVPDLIAGIALEFGKLDTVMVTPTSRAITSIDGLFSRGKELVLGKTQGLLDGLAGKIKTTIPSIFGGSDGKGGILGGLMNTGLSALLGPAGPLSGVISAGLSALGNLAMAGAKKIWNGIKSMFGGGEEGTQVNPARDSWFGELGGTVDSVGKLLADKGLDGESARKLIERVFMSRTMKDFVGAKGEIDRILGRAHDGGLILSHAIQRFHVGGRVPGLAGDERMIVAQTGEGILNRRAMASFGAANLHALNRGAAVGGPSINVTIYANGDYNSPMAQRKLAATVSDELNRQLRQRRLLSAH